MLVNYELNKFCDKIFNKTEYNIFINIFLEIHQENIENNKKAVN